VIVIFAACLLGVGSAQSNDSAALKVALVSLITRPENFDGKRVQVSAWGVIEYEGAALYLSEADHQYLITRDGVWLDLSGISKEPEEATGYFQVVGTFLAGDVLRGHAGRLTKIEKIIRLGK
jgi:hypothetical protein